MWVGGWMDVFHANCFFCSGLYSRQAGATQLRHAHALWWPLPWGGVCLLSREGQLRRSWRGCWGHPAARLPNSGTASHQLDQQQVRFCGLFLLDGCGLWICACVQNPVASTIIISIGPLRRTLNCNLGFHLYVCVCVWESKVGYATCTMAIKTWLVWLWLKWTIN